MLEGMRADFAKVDAISAQVWRSPGSAQVRAQTAAGTDIVAELNPSYRWLKTSGIISPNKWGNLPGGEVFTTPGEVNGSSSSTAWWETISAPSTVTCSATPLTIQVEKNRLGGACANRELQDEFWRYTHTDENSDRVGEFAIGTNIGAAWRHRQYPAG